MLTSYKILRLPRAGLLTLLCLVGLVGCQAPVVCEGDPEDLVRPEAWEVATHCPGVAADYASLFAAQIVHRMEIQVSAADHKAAMADLDNLLSGPGSGDNIDNPMYVPVTVGFGGGIWSRVGMRYKGNSSLKSAWQRGIRKLSFRLKFDHYEQQEPALKDQRFYGFRKMTFGNNYNDPSFMRDKLAADIFRAGGIPAARSAFVRVHLDHGQGPVYFGLYTMIEDPSDEMMQSQLGSDSGNLYKPEGDGAKWPKMLIKEAFEKKSNEDKADWSDVEAALKALHADRKTDPAAWRAGLEKVMDVDGFIRCLALNQTMENWDSYGFMAHNYYLYGDPARGGRLRWIPWDLNMSLIHVANKTPNPGDVMLAGVDSTWPLIRFLLDDPEYKGRYGDQLKAAVAGPFAMAMVIGKMEAYHKLLAPHVIGAQGEAMPYTFLSSKEEMKFENALTNSKNGLKPHAQTRYAAVIKALGLTPP